MIKAKYYKVAMKANKQQWQVVENRRGGEVLIGITMYYKMALSEG